MSCILSFCVYFLFFASFLIIFQFVTSNSDFTGAHKNSTKSARKSFWNFQHTENFAEWNCDWQTNKKKGRKSTPEFIKQAGFSSATHTAQTDDGYDLTIHQILPLSEQNDEEKYSKRCCLFMHGFLSASDSFFFQPKILNSLPVLMTLEGCNVFLGNFRGNCYSRGHKNLTTDDPKYWKFTYHELGVFDLATSIDFVLKTGKCSALTLIGHSLGTTAFFVLMSTRPEYNQKVDFAVQLSPTVFLSHATSPVVRIFALLFARPGRMSDLSAFVFGGPKGEFFPCLPIRNKIFASVCGLSTQASAVCQMVPFGLMGIDFCQFYLKDFSRLIRQIPCPSSVFVNVHYLQQVFTGTFCQFNHGKSKNRKKYGSSRPPCYDLPKITTRVRLFHSSNDWICTHKDVEKLAAELPNVSLHKVKYELWNHMDHITAIDALPLLYCPILEWTGFTSPEKCQKSEQFVAECHHS